MCNPRRITIRTVENLARAWSRVFTGEAQATGEAAAAASLSLPYAVGMPASLRQRFELRLGADPDWRLREGRYVTALDDGQIAYDPASGELTLSVRLTATVTATGTGSHRMDGMVESRIDETFLGTGRTNADARRAAEQRSRAVVDEERRRLDRDADAAAAGVDAQAGQQAADAAARQESRERLDGLLQDRVEQLHDEAANRLAAQRDAYLIRVNRVHAAAVQDVLEAVIRSRGARNLRRVRHGSSVELSFELEG